MERAMRETIRVLKEIANSASESVGEEVIVSLRPLFTTEAVQFDFVWFESNELKRLTVGLSLAEIERVSATIVEMAMGRFHIQISRPQLGQSDPRRG